MTPKLTSDQREALRRQGSPVLVEDEETRRVYFLLDRSMLEAMQEQSDMAAILHGIADAEAGRLQPLDEAFHEIEANLRARFAP